MSKSHKLLGILMYICVMRVCAKMLNGYLQRLCIFEYQFDSVSECAPQSIFMSD